MLLEELARRMISLEKSGEKLASRIAQARHPTGGFRFVEKLTLGERAGAS